MATRIVVFAGSIRTGAFSGKLAALAAKELAAAGAEAELLSLADYPLPIYNGDEEAADGVPAPAKALRDRLAGAHGVFVVTPEYNAGIPPLLKNAIDWVSRVKGGEGDPFKGPVWAIGCSSPGAMGGYRASIMLRQTLALGLGALVLGDQASVGGAGQAFDDTGALKDERTAGFLRGVLGKLVAEAGRRAG
ncbi:NAD(P)H-dependent oxidoreductase [Ancylobacter sp. 6x-1]|uniref:NAD(P)H-dependent oxidoreductase n=1 Tax=Ancylobacter crimeensis TaxID=2579147 RepID=A0ABT0DAE7_9HYPH|nr:NADPH-dependent FMN reductase [Ancylobacter crimeensis]MCK0196910.1 NAD(P)H-dependent oxidoreductase [Ancylobacter crimeensis]